MWHPHLVRAVFSVCTPYVPPRDTYMALEDMVKVLPNFRYQLQLAGPDVEAAIVGREKLRQFLCAMYSGRTPSGEPGFTTADGVLFRNLDAIGPSPLIIPEETDFYADEYARHGMHGPLNWYRTTRVNFEEEKVLLEEGPARTRISTPSLIVTASADSALPPSKAAAMDRYFDDLTKREVQAGHWALWQAPEDVNRHVGEFLTRVLGGCEQASRL
jgi:soluble epoxide hydrolase/lipid-phosphate phosphatase